jgi:hypothetical protein
MNNFLTINWQPHRLSSQNTARPYRKRVAGMHKVLAAPESDPETFEAICLLIEGLAITPSTVSLHCEPPCCDAGDDWSFALIPGSTERGCVHKG